MDNKNNWQRIVVAVISLNIAMLFGSSAIMHHVDPSKDASSSNVSPVHNSEPCEVVDEQMPEKSFLLKDLSERKAPEKMCENVVSSAPAAVSVVTSEYVPDTEEYIYEDTDHSAESYDSIFVNESKNFPGDDSLFQSYVDFLVYKKDPQSSNINAKLPKSSGRIQSDEVTEAIISILKDKAAAVAEGDVDSSIFTISADEIKAMISDPSAVNSYSIKGNNQRFIHDTLLNDCPYELYWYDKTNGCSFSTSKVDDVPDSFTITFSVSADYYAEKPTSNEKPTKLDTVKTKRAAAAAANIADVISGIDPNWSDYAVIEYFKDWIMDNTDYNEDCENAEYGDPWQLIYVFDGDKTTNVVCEGYSKAFKYLCDQYKECFNSYVECRLVTGMLDYQGTQGLHMWNVLELAGNNYLVDITNCEETFLTFMAGTTNKQFIEEKLSAVCIDDLWFNYDMGINTRSDMYFDYKESDLLIAEDYCQTYTVTWQNYDGTILEKDVKVGQGETPKYNGQTPVHKDGYEFDGWDSISPVNRDITFTAQYKLIKYNVSYSSAFYDGSPQTPNTVSVDKPHNAVVRYGREEGSYDLTAVPSFTDAGIHTIYFRITADGYKTVTGSYTLTINRAQNSWITEPAIEGWTYGETPSNPNAASRFGSAVFEYAASQDGPFDSSKPDSAGDYYMRATVNGTDNYEALSKTVPFTISKADIEYSSNNFTAVYNGTAQSAGVVTATKPTNAIVLYGDSADSCTLEKSPDYSDVGSYTVYYTINGGSNYKSANGCFTFSISKADNFWTTEPSMAGWTFGEAESDPAASARFGTVSISYSDSPDGLFTAEKPKAAGKHFMKAFAEGTKNYNEISTIVPFTIEAGELIIAVPGTSSFIFDTAAHMAPAVKCENNESAVIRYGTEEGRCTSETAPSFTAAGDYTVYYKATADNYNPKAGSYTVRITKAENTWVKAPSISDWTEGSKASQPSAEAAFGTTVFTYSAVRNGEYSNEQPLQAGDYFMKAVVEPTKNYGGLEAIVQFTIMPGPEEKHDSDTDEAESDTQHTDSDSELTSSDMEQDSSSDKDSDTDSDAPAQNTDASDSDTDSEKPDDKPLPETDSEDEKESGDSDSSDIDSGNTDTNTEESDTGKSEPSDTKESDDTPHDGEPDSSETEDQPNKKPEKQQRMPGDISNDNSTDSYDALIVLRFSIMLECDLSEEELEYADVNGDGIVDSADALLILRYSLGLEPIERLSIPSDSNMKRS